MAEASVIEKSAQPAGSASDRGSAKNLAQPFFFMVPFWGERYRRYYVDDLLPSLLAPNNLPLLRAEDGHRFLLATTREDWDAIVDLPIMGWLRRHATPTLIEIPKPANTTAPGSTNAILHQNVAQRLLAEAAFEAKAYGCLFSPDFIISDGMVAALLGHARAGHRLVMCPSLRQAEEPAIAELARLGYLPSLIRPSEAGTSISVPPRLLAGILVRYLHPEMAKFEEGAIGQPPLAPFRYWRILGQNGIFVHTFHGVPVLMDYSAIRRHDVACLEHHSFEDVYVARNFGGLDEFQVVQDSDEFCILSLTPAVIGQMSLPSQAAVRADDGLIRRLFAALAISYCTMQLPLKRRLFKYSVRWHSDDLDATALELERRISLFADGALRYSRFTYLPAKLLLTCRETALYRRSAPLLRSLARALRGDSLVWSYIGQRLAFEICRPFKRALFWYSSGGEDLDRFDPFHLSFRRTAGRRVVSDALFSANSKTAVILGLGQSNIANEGDASALHEPKGEVYNFNFFDGKCYPAKDPLLGASIDRSNVLTRLGELLADHGNYQHVLLVPIAHGGTYARDWAPGGKMHPRLDRSLKRLGALGIRITHIVWQQGEAEASEENSSPDDWVRQFMAMVAAIRAAGVGAPIYVAQCTICRNDPNEKIRSAQRQVVDPAAGILSGPDIDRIEPNERYDGCHLSAAGLQSAAQMWYEALRHGVCSPS